MHRALPALLVLFSCGAPNAPWTNANATQRLTVALVSLAPEVSPEVNRERIIASVDQAMKDRPDTRLISFGELSLGWYWKGFDATYQPGVAEPLDGPTITALRQKSIEHRTFISIGFAERSDATIFNAAVVIDDQGAIVAHKRKANFVPMDDFGGFTRGDKTPPTFTLDGLRGALLICNDFNDATTREAVKNDPSVRLVVLPQASAGLRPDVVDRSPYPFGGAWMLAPQRLGWEGTDRYFGSWVVDPNGAVAASAMQTGVLFSELSFEPVVSAR